MKNTERLKFLYERYLDSSATDAQVSELMEMIAEGEQDKELEDMADAAWESEEPTRVLEPAKARRIFAAIVREPTQKTSDKVLTIRRLGWAAAAAAVLVIGTFTIMQRFSGKAEQPQAAMMQTKSNAEHRLVKLADGSTVVLNENSYLRYPAKFTATKREVSLVGEGYFDIKHESSHPFIVHIGQIDITVLGTAFNVRAYNNSKLFTVTVTRGRVSVSRASKVLGVLMPNEQLAFNQADDKTVQLAVNASNAVAWQQKDVFFENITMQEAAAELEGRFKVKIVFANEAAKNCRFTATFLHGEKLTDILQVICDFNNTTYKTTDDGRILISGRGCS